MTTSPSPQPKSGVPAHAALHAWVDEMTQLCQPDQVYWCDGSEAEKERLTQHAVDAGVLIRFNQEKLPGCYLHRSNPNDVARVEELTFICTRTPEAAGPTNHWMAPAAMYEKLYGLARGAMRGRTMYVVPYLMGMPGSPLAKVGVELTDSIYVALSMRIMTRMGQIAWDQLGDAGRFTKGLHCNARYQSRAPLHRPFSAGQHHHLGRLELRRQRAAGEEVPGAAARLLPRPHRALDGRAHADPWRRVAHRRKRITSRPRFPARVARRTSPCSFRRSGSRAGKSPPWATILPGCGRATTAGSTRSIPRPGTLASCRARTRSRTQTR